MNGYVFFVLLCIPLVAFSSKRQDMKQDACNALCGEPGEIENYSGTGDRKVDYDRMGGERQGDVERTFTWSHCKTCEYLGWGISKLCYCRDCDYDGWLPYVPGKSKMVCYQCSKTPSFLC